MPHMNPHATPRQRHRRAFTLMEAAIAIVLLSALMLIVGRISVTVGDYARSQLVRAAMFRDVTLAIDALDRDMIGARPCDVNELGAAFHRFEPHKISVYRDLNDDRIVDLVVWRAGDGALLRAEVFGDGNCSFDDADDQLAYATVLDGTEPGAETALGDEATFVGWIGGTSTLESGDYGTCVADTASTFNRCAFDRVEIHTIVDREDGGTATIDRAWDVEELWSQF